MKVSTRIGLGFALVLFIGFAANVVALWRLSAVADATEKMMQVPLEKERLVSDLYSNIQAGIRRTIAIAKSSDSSLAQVFAADSAKTTAQSSELQKKIEALLDGEKEKEIFKRFAETRQAFVAARLAIAKAQNDGNMDEANKIFESRFTPISAQYTAVMDELLAEERRKIDETAQRIDEIYHQGRTLLILMSLFALGAGVACTLVLSRGLLRELGGEPAYAAAIANDIAQGNLNTAVEVRRGDNSSMLHSMAVMRDSLARIVAEVRGGTDAIITASNQVAVGSQDLSSRTEEQAGSLEETASSMEELTSTVKQNADNARQANTLADAASHVAEKGGQMIEQVVGTMGEINSSASKIVDIIGVIDGIAFQTNILALNAAVEAARAGEQGRGFAVVASEVRNLAQRSAAAAKEIKTLIGDSVERVETGSKLVNDAGATMNEIVASVRRVTDIMGEITAASQEQTAGIEQINQAIAQMDRVTQQNASLVEETTAASAAMQEQAARLGEIVSVFALGASQHAAAPTHVARLPAPARK